MKAFAFACHAPDEVMLKLQQSGIDRKEICIVGEEEVITRKSKRNHFIFMTTGSFRANRSILETMDATAYVCDDPLSLSHYNFTPADYKREEFFHVDGFSLLPMGKLKKCADVPIVRAPFSAIDEAVKVAKNQITFLNQFMTFIYSLPSETHQKPLKELVCKWMASKEPFSKYCKVIVKNVSLTEKQLNRLTAILTSETTALYREALQQPGDEDDVAKIYKISAYELRFIRAINKGPSKKAVAKKGSGK